jgi:Metallo-beta-lactamase superfamily
MIVVEALPARGGDCLWVEWDDEDSRRRRMLIDGGWGGNNELTPALRDRFARQPSTSRDFDLVVCTHVDNDHIGGLLGLLASPPDGFTARDIWFNGSVHLGSVPGTGDTLGGRSGRRLADLLRDRNLPWNRATGGRPVVVPGTGALPTFRLPGLTLTLLSPTWDRLRALGKIWPPETSAPELTADVLSGDVMKIPWRWLADAPYVADRSPANGSSIAFCAEHVDGSRVLFGADAHAEVLVSSLHRLQSADRYRIDVCKVPHHGSAANISPALLGRLDCGNWLVSTHGGDVIRPASKESQYRPGEGRHPSVRAMARIIFLANSRPTFWFNYRSASTERYDDNLFSTDFGFRAEYPLRAGDGITVAVEMGEVFRGGSAASGQT